MSQRTERVAGVLHAELAELVRHLKDPRLQAATLITITQVQISDDLSVAKVMVSIIAEPGPDVPEGPRDVLRAIGRARPFLQGQLGRRLRAKKIPELRFYLDETADHLTHIDELLAAVAADPPVGASSDPGRPESAAERPAASDDDHGPGPLDGDGH